ncbi:XK-related protein 5 [Gastrophryne carolinensis]
MGAAGAAWLLLVSLLLYVAERAAECAVVVHYFLTGQSVWAGWTLGLLLPGCLIQVLSFIWLRTDGNPQCISLSLAHVFQLGILKRHVDYLHLAVCGGENKCQEKEWAMKQGDLSLLRLSEALLQALPQLFLQTYIYMTLEQADIYAASCALVCLLSVSWALVYFSHFLCLLRPGHLCLPWASVLCQLIWRMGMIGSRAMTLVVFARVYHSWVFAVGGGHWLVMSFWLVAQQSDVIRRPCYWRLFNILLGAVYVFCFINVRDGPSRYRIAVFYVIMLLENCILLLMATDFLQGAVWGNVKLSVAVMSGFLIGCAALIIYYTLLHPKSTEISQSFKKVGASPGRADESVLASKWSSRSLKKEVTDLFGRRDIGARPENEDAGVEYGDPAWMAVAKKHHYLLFLKLAMKTGNLSKINAAFGNGGFEDFFSLGCAQNGQQPFISNSVVVNLNHAENPKTSKTVASVMDPEQGDASQDHKCEPHECSTYVTFRNSKTGENLNPKNIQTYDNEDDRLGISGKALGVGGSVTTAGLGSPTLYYSAHTERPVLSGTDPHCIDVPETVLKNQTDGPLKEIPETEAPKIPVICVSPILSLATNSNFRRSIGEDTGSLDEESELSQDDSEISETAEPLMKRGYHLLAVGVLPFSVKERLVQEEKPCFTSTPKPPATNMESEQRQATKAKRRLEQLTGQV